MSIQEETRPQEASPEAVDHGPRPPERAPEAPAGPQSRWLALLFAILPLAALGLVIWVFARTNAGLQVNPPAPIEVLTVERTVMDATGFHLYVRNEGPAEVAIAQAVVNDAIWAMSVEPAAPIGRLRRAVVNIPYPWVEGEAYAIALISTNAIVTPVDVPVAFATPTPRLATVWSFTLIGIYVGIIPIFLGLLWLPLLRRITRPWWIVLLAATAGILVYLGIDSLSEAIELSAEIGGAFQGIGLTGIGVVGTILLLEALSRLKTGGTRGEAASRLSLAFMIALGIGVHNLGEGLAIGAAFNIGEAALGAFLVIGFILQNITEGLGIIAPIVRDRPSFGALLRMGLIAGAPAILGCWIGGFSYFRPLSVLFLGIGAGAVFQVAAEIARLLRRDWAERRGPILTFAGATAGMLALYITGLLIK